MAAGTTKCSGSPAKYNGKACASTTHYTGGAETACGCPSYWSVDKTKYTAAGSDALFGSGSAWCGSGCGKCYKLTPTCSTCSPDGKGAGNTNSITLMIADLCPSSSSSTWCPKKGSTNKYGYGAHFDMWGTGAYTSLGWDNPEVTYEEVSCGGTAPTTAQYDSDCECASNARAEANATAL
eukprot:TRINITY_DN7800_c0_g1_i1.p2 TRINITY_DN7800_c0_g1~~TRINITY_DN7800_c0_g1_i1.p2  ORF type:complete len:206 (+),score=51.89 TRINITY_DN7800_c0_g1_i1:81-620(+)